MSKKKSVVPAAPDAPVVPKAPEVPEPDKAGIPAAVQLAIEGKIAEPQLAEIVANFVHIAGGPKAIAVMMFTAYTDPKSTAMVRQRILDTVVRGMKWSNDKSEPTNDLGTATKEDLQREAEQILLRMGNAEKKEIK